MAKKRTRPVENPLLKDRVGVIVGSPVASAEQAPAHSEEKRNRRVRTDQPVRRELTKKQGRGEVQVKARFTHAEAEEIERFTRTLSSYLRTNVKGSEITRALWTLAIRSQDQLAEVSHKAPNMNRPSYGNRLARAEFEDAIAEFIQRILR